MNETNQTAGLDLPELTKSIIAAGQAAPSADNSQPWRFCWQQGELSLHYRPDAAAAKVFGGDAHCERLSMGAVAENLMQAARAAGVDVAWHLNPEGPDYLRGRLAADAPVTDALRRHPLFQRHTNRLAYREDPIPDQTLQELAALSEAPCRLLVMTEKAQIARVAALVERASTLRFRTREIHEWFGEVLRFSPEQVATGTGLDVATIDLPPGGRLLLRLIQDWDRLALLNRLGMYKLLAQIESTKAKNSAAFIAVVGPSGSASEVAAGRLMERAWILLNAKGIAVQPFYVVTDLTRRADTARLPPELMEEAGSLQRELTAFLGDAGSLHMLLRAGLPNKAPVRSRRLPLETACDVE